MRTVPRHLFVPAAPVQEAYDDQAVITKSDADGAALSCASVPSIVAMMLDQLDIHPGDRILEIGAGTGYNAALLADLTGPSGHVTTVDIDEEVTAQARQALNATGYRHVHVATADGALGDAGHAPYDRIIVTVGAWDIPPAWWAQLEPGGRLVVPLRWRGQTRSIGFTHHHNRLRSDSVQLCGFVPMLGQDGERTGHIDTDGHVALCWDADQPIDSAVLRGVLHKKAYPGGSWERSATARPVRTSPTACVNRSTPGTATGPPNPSSPPTRQTPRTTRSSTRTPPTRSTPAWSFPTDTHHTGAAASTSPAWLPQSYSSRSRSATWTSRSTEGRCLRRRHRPQHDRALHPDPPTRTQDPAARSAVGTGRRTAHRLRRRPRSAGHRAAVGGPPGAGRPPARSERCGWGGCRPPHSNACRPNGPAATLRGKRGVVPGRVPFHSHACSEEVGRMLQCGSAWG